jgi:hypothetical protein
MADDISVLEDAAQAPKRGKTPTQEVEAHSLSEKIEADKYVRATEAMASRRMFPKVFKAIPPGAN